VADVINMTSALTPLSQAIAVGLFVALAVGLVLALLGLAGTKLRPGPSPWLVVLSSALFIIGAVAASAVSTRFGAISLLYGTEGPPDVDLVASWPLVRIAGDAVALLGLVTLAVTASVATVRLRTGSRATEGVRSRSPGRR
jgi:hypothetical protein